MALPVEDHDSSLAVTVKPDKRPSDQEEPSHGCSSSGAPSGGSAHGQRDEGRRSPVWGSSVPEIFRQVALPFGAREPSHMRCAFP